jgi:hypothetical protein
VSIYKITDNGESPFHIVAHRYADETVRYACSELQKYILKATGAVVPYFSDICPMRSPEIRIGDNVRYEKTKCDDLAPEGFRIYANGEHINITGSTSRGILYGIYRFLEIFLNFRCFTKDCETIDQKDVFEIDLDEISEAPAFEFRDAYFRFAYDGDFCAKKTALPIKSKAVIYYVKLQALNNSLCISRDNHFLVGSDKLNADFGIIGGQLALSAVDRGVVNVLVKLNAEALEVVANAFSKARLVFAQACGKYDSVAAAESYVKAADVLCNLVVEHLVSKSRSVVALFFSRGNVAVVGRNARNTKQT